MDMTATFPGNKRVDAQYKGFIIRTDQSAANGGDSSAPAPFDLFLASIATCAGIYVLEFCQHRSIAGILDIHQYGRILSGKRKMKFNGCVALNPLPIVWG